MTQQPKFIVVVFDGLRRDMITPELAPTLTQFLMEGADFPLSRSVFPSATRVNSATLSSGAQPAGTGVISNKFFHSAVFDDQVIHTGKYAHASAAAKGFGGRFLEAKTLGECAAEAGLTVTVSSSGSGGTSYLLHPHADQFGHLRLCYRDWACSTPATLADATVERYGPVPKTEHPNIPMIKYQTDVLLDHILPDIDPDIALVWFSDPDSTYHPCGLGSPESKAAIKNADAQFARILDWVDGRDDAERYQIFVMSDHGQITARDRIDMKTEIAKSGFVFGNHFLDDADFAGTAGYSTALRVRDGDNGRVAALAEWLQEQPWRGLIFTANGNGVEGSVPGTFDRALLNVENARAPELYFTLKTDDEPNQWGISGACTFSSASVPDGGGTHGGLHIKEMNNLLGVRGSLFKRRYVSASPANHGDIAPTILSLLGIDAPTGMSGRRLGEALAAGGENPPPTETLEHAVSSGPVTQHLRQWRVGDVLYIDQGWTA
jgi:phosphonoacetate hydrolase